MKFTFFDLGMFLLNAGRLTRLGLDQGEGGALEDSDSLLPQMVCISSLT